MPKIKRVTSLAVVITASLLIVIGCKNKESFSPVKRTLLSLGTTVEIEVRNTEPARANEAINLAFSEIRRINDTYSPFKEDGPLRKLNHDTITTLQTTAELYYLLAVCDTIHRATSGAFDPTVEPLITLWKVWSDTIVIPSDSAIQAAKDLCGWEKIELKDDNVLTRKPGVMFSFGAIAKGYAVDRALRILVEHDIKEALVNAGGDIRVLGNNWPVGIQHPSLSQKLLNTVTVNNRAVATSGDYMQYHETKGKRYHHILNPATGYPAEGCHSVTIVAPTCIHADAYATGVFVLGPEKGLELVNETPGLEAMIVDDNDSVFCSDGFEFYLKE